MKLGAVVLRLQLWCHPDSFLSLKRDDVLLLLSALQLKIRSFKGSEAGMVNRLALRVSLVSDGELLRHLTHFGDEIWFGGGIDFPGNDKVVQDPSKTMKA